MVQWLSTRQSSLESRFKLLAEIASENGITLSMEGETTLNNKVEQRIIILITIYIDHIIEDYC